MNQPKSLQAGTRVDDYEITETLWTTNSGFIYRARDLDRERDVLIQEYLPAIFADRHWSGIHAMALDGLADEFDQGLTQFLREARILAQINDPYVCRVYEYTETNATAYMVLDYEPGQTLMERLTGHKTPLDESELRQLLVPLLKGLRVAHAAELLHRDIHPANIYLRDVGPPVLIGFGSPAVTPRDGAEHHVEQRVAPGYSPVEQYQSDGDVGPWTDLYALGATMYRCLSGNTPVDATRRITHIAQDKEDPLVPAMELGSGDFSAGLLSAIDWMLEPMASDRPESAGAVLGQLSDESATAPGGAKSKPSPAPAGKKTKSRKTQSAKKNAGKRTDDATYRDHSQRRAPAPSPSAETGEPARDTPPRPVVNVYQSRKSRKTLNTAWGWPLLMVVAGLSLIGVFVLYQPEPSPSVAVNKAMPETPVPAPAPDEEYPPPDIPETVKFDRDHDQERAAEYRDLERQVEQIERTLAAAERNMDQSRLVAPVGDNALADYRSVLALDPDNTDARLGIAAIQRELVNGAEAAFTGGNIDEARRLLDQASEVRGETDDVLALKREIEQHVAEKAREAQQADEENRRREQAKQEAEQARREQIAELVEQADTALQDGRLTQPPGDNALGYYRRVLRLEPEHTAALQGVDRVGRQYLDLAADALAKDQLDQADSLLNTAAAIVPDNESVSLLKKQLETRRSVAEQEAREALQQAQSQESQPAQTTSTDQDKAAGDENMEEGITAYYGGNYEFAFRRLNPLAEQGDPRAKFRVAMMYFHGRGTGQDVNLARTLINEALPKIRDKAESGIAWAQADLGSLFADGIVLTEDDTEAVRLYTLAAEQGYAGAQTNLGVMYANGEGVTQNRANAVLWLRRAAAQGDRIAQNNLQALGVQ